MAMSMEFLLRLKLSAILFLLFPVLAFIHTAFIHTRTLPHHHLPPEKDDIQWVISKLRGSDYRFFAASLMMVDIQSLLSSEDSYTFFAPTDDALYNLLFSCKSWQEYMDAVKYHIVNVKLSYQNLRRLPDGAQLDTLMPNGSLILATVALDDDTDEEEENAVMVNNVVVSIPDLYYDNRFAVHGLTAAVDVLSVLASRKDPEAMAAASWESEFLGNPLAESKPLNVYSDPIQNVSAILTCGIPIRHPTTTTSENTRDLSFTLVLVLILATVLMSDVCIPILDVIQET